MPEADERGQPYQGIRTLSRTLAGTCCLVQSILQPTEAQIWIDREFLKPPHDRAGTGLSSSREAQQVISAVHHRHTWRT